MRETIWLIHLWDKELAFQIQQKSVEATTLPGSMATAARVFVSPGRPKVTDHFITVRVTIFWFW